MLIQKTFFVYILTNKGNRVLYTGVTNDLQRRLFEHRNGKRSSFTGRYKTRKLVYFEEFGDAYLAISREKQIKGGSRIKKMKLIESLNPNWNDLIEFVDE